MNLEKPAPFVVGVSRSGTTLLRLMLDAHPELAIPPETHFIPDAVAAVLDSPRPADAFCTTVSESPRWEDFGLSRAEFVRRVVALQPFDVGEALRTFYRLYAGIFDKRRWGDKSPHYLQDMAAVQRVLPEAHFVHVIRDGRDVACSILPLSWGPASAGEAADWWRAQIELARVQARLLPAYLEIRYEDLVAETENKLAEICDFISLPFEGAMVDYHRHAAQRLTELEHDLVHPERHWVLPGTERVAMMT